METIAKKDIQIEKLLKALKKKKQQLEEDIAKLEKRYVDLTKPEYIIVEL